MNRLLIAPLLAAPLLLASCDKTDEPRTPKSYRISWIGENVDDSSYQIFEYTDNGLISEWCCYDDDAEYHAGYQHSAEGIIDISAEEKSGDERRLFSERLRTSQGVAHRAEGTYQQYSADRLIIRKRYTADFSYTAGRHLAGISISEWITDSEGNDLGTPLTWSVTLNWDPAGNLVRYAEYTNPARPMLDAEYIYYGGETVSHLPLLQRPILRGYYLPLQYCGYLGEQSKSLLQKATYTSSGTVDYSFSYDLSVSTLSSWVESYTVTGPTSTRDFIIAWDAFTPAAAK